MRRTVPLKRVARLVYGDALASEVRIEGDVPVIGSGGASGFHNAANAAGPTIVIGRKGSYGTVHWQPQDCFVIDTAYYMRQVSPDLDLRWLYYALQAVDLKRASQDVGVPGLSREEAHEVRVPATPLDEQRRIADFLDAETARIDHLTRLQQSVTEKLVMRDRAVRDGLVDDLTHRVGELPLRRYSPKIEQGSSPQCENHPRDPGEWGVLKLSAVKQGRFFPDENKQLPAGIEPAREYEVQDGDLLVSRANTPDLVGDVAVVSGAGMRLLLPDLIYRVRLDPRMRADFVAQVLLSSRVRTLVQAVARGSSQSMVKLRGEDIRELPIPRAEIKQQQALIAAIDDQQESSEKLRAVINGQLALLTERRQALITAAVTGEITI